MKRITALLFCIVLITACGKPDPDILPPEEPKPEPAVEPTPPAPQPNITYTKKSTSTVTDAHTQAAMLAADITRVLALGSALGENFTMNNKTRKAVAEILDIDYQPTKGEELLFRVYAAGTPRLKPAAKGTLYPTNWETWRWLEASIDRTTPMAAAAKAITAELFAAELLLDRDQMTDRYDAVLLGVAAGGQVEHLQFNARTGNTYTDLDEAGNPVEGYDFLNQIRMLTILSRIALFASAEEYQGTVTAHNAVGYANQLFNQILAQQKREPELYRALSAQGLRETIEAYALFAAVTDAYKWQLLALSHIRILGKQLQAKVGVGGILREANMTQLQAQSAAIVGLSYAYRATDEEGYQSSAVEAWQGMQRLWDKDAGLFKPDEDSVAYDYTPGDLADAFAALNAAKHVLEQDADEQFGALFTNAVIKSGIVPAELRSDFESIPDAQENFRSPAFIARVRYDPAAQQWQVIDGSFQTAGAMALAAALLQGAEDEGGDERIADFGMPKPQDLETKNAAA